jgi:hypothetical protein
MLAHRFEVQCERHEEPITPAARARTSSAALVSSLWTDAPASPGEAGVRARVDDRRTAV